VTEETLAARLGRLFDGEVEPPLDLVAALIAQLDPDAPPEADLVAQLDRLAEGVPPLGEDPPGELMTHVFGTVGLAGATERYYEADNSYLHRVLERRVGIPIALAVVVIEVGRRVEVELNGVGMPGHFLVGDGAEPQRWFDPFAGGRPLTAEDCRLLFSRLHPGAEWDPQWLRPVGVLEITDRMLQNLRLIHLRHGDPARLIEVLALRAALPVSTLGDQVELASVLARMGRHEAAAVQRERLARIDPAQAAVHLRAAYLHRAHRN
jgi:regulator of sirC expression with transglutaminase-like and TPR domain